jgi:hypothetical protein
MIYDDVGLPPVTPPTITTFDLSTTPVSRFLVRTLAGSDKVTLLGSRTRPMSIPAEMFGDDGYDWLRGGAGDDRLIGGSDGDRLDGSAGDDALLGAAGADSLIGGAGDDELFGGDGNDQLVGGLGVDTLSGEAGNDRLDAVDRGARDVLVGGTENTGEEWRLFGPRPLDHAFVDPTEGRVRGVEFVEVIRGRHRVKFL